MIDIPLFKNILEEEEGFIEHSDFVTDDLVMFLRQYQASKWVKLFKKVPLTISPATYFWEMRCWNCGTVSRASGTKSAMLDYISGKRCHNKVLFLCAACSEEDKKQKKASEDIERANRALRRQEMEQQTTSKFLTDYLDPDKSWDRGSNLHSCFSQLYDEFRFGADQERVADYIRSMDYVVFLKTPFWKCVAAEVYRKANWRCSLCGKNGELHAHHRDYSIHGYELLHVGKDLICLCSGCHEQFHSERQVEQNVR